MSSDQEALVQSKLRFSWRGQRLDLLAPHSVFSSASIDDGTILLLENLPAGAPEAFLDLGCGYGALGLPLAARFPRSLGLLADRDLLAVEFARRNAAAHGLANVEVAGSLGYRDLPPACDRFDWILANVPARAGERVLELFLAGGRRRLRPGGEMRIVIIAPLAARIDRISRDRGLGGWQVAKTPRHAVFAFPPGEGPDAGEDAYLRDQIDLDLPGLAVPLRLARPTDLADEPHRLPLAVPLLAESLPVPHPRRVLVYRSGYGLLAALALARWSGAQVVATDRDLLGTEYTRRNCAPWGGRLRVIESARLGEAHAAGPFDLILGETLPPLGPAATLEELRAVRAMLAPGGTALVLGLAKQWREFLRQAADELGVSVRATREAAAVYEVPGA